MKGELAETVAADSTKAGKHKRRDDTSTVRYSALFRDTIPLSRMTAISLIAPGFSQLYNKQAWKIPILYGVTGGLAYLGFQQSSKYKEIKKEYNSLVSQNAAQEQLDPVQCEMIRYNTRRTVFFVGAIASYLYFLCDGVLNYNGPENSVKKATTLSTLCPGCLLYTSRVSSALRSLPQYWIRSPKATACCSSSATCTLFTSRASCTFCL